MPVIVTNCTARKRGAKTALVMGPDLIGSSLADTVSQWRSEAARCPAERAAVDLYTGRSIAEARRATERAGASLFFVSAGLGVVPADCKIPAYDLTPSQATGGLAVALARHQATPAQWWYRLSRAGMSRLVREQSAELVLVAVPATYLKMLALDLSEIQPADAGRLRIFTSPAGVSEVPTSLRASVMPYDDRLESVPAFAGTRADFPQRALRHFIERLDGHSMSLEAGRALVEKSLNAYRLRHIPDRRRLDDEQVRALIIQRWDSCQGRSAQLLRALRDEELVACEQGRFAQIWRDIRLDMTRTAATGAEG